MDVILASDHQGCTRTDRRELIERLISWAVRKAYLIRWLNFTSSWVWRNMKSYGPALA